MASNGTKNDAKHKKGRTSRSEAARKAAETRRLQGMTVPGMEVIVEQEVTDEGATATTGDLTVAVTEPEGEADSEPEGDTKQ